MRYTVADATPAQLAVIDAFFARHAANLSEHQLVLSVARLNTMERESFRVDASCANAEITAAIRASDLQSVRWALNALRTWIVGGMAAPLSVGDRPDFRWRGVIEGFYGNPWTHAQRLRGIEHFADFGMNLFLLAPKDAAWQRLRWRDPLSASFITEMRELFAAGERHAVAVSACVSPGLSVQYSDDADVASVVAKFEQLAAVGARHFGLLLDDIPDTLSNDADIARYTSVAHAHADFANRVRERLVASMPSAHVILCPMHYAGRGTEPYLQVMGDELHPQIELMWTGRDICSAYLDISDAVIFDRTTRRPPFYWDNYPVNDGAMARRLHIGPFHGREAGLHRYSAGLLANPMELFEASLLPLGTVGAYLWDTTGYDPFAAWDAVLGDLVPDDADRAAIRELFRNTLGLTGGWAPAFNTYLGASETARRAGQPTEAAALTRAHAEGIRASIARIERDGFCAPLLRSEILPWLAKYALGAEVLEGVAAALDRCTPNADGGLDAPNAVRDALNALRAQLASNPMLVFGDGFDMLLFTMTAEIRFTD